MRQFSKQTLRDFFFGSPTVGDKERIASWFNADDAEFDNELFVLWNELPESIDRGASEKAFERFNVSLSRKGEKRIPAQRHPFRRMLDWSLKIAACLVIPLGIYAIYLHAQTQRPKNWIEKHVPYGETLRVTLPDHSTIWLNAGSKIIYPEKFNREIRQVFVTGEAYADIAKDSSRPFYLSAGNVNIKVLGTKFNVKSYPEQAKTEVTLIEGSIALDAEIDGEIRHYTLKPGYYMSFDCRSGAINTDYFSPESYTSWSDAKSGLYFRNQPLEEIVLDLERKFNVQIILRDEQLRHERYFATFVNGESLDDILKFLSMGNSFRYVSQRNVIDIYKY